MADLPSISLITATYNAAQHLPGLIESVRQQSDRAFEWIVIDGASEDGTLDLIRAAQDVLTDYVSEPDFGIFHALNKGIQRATGDYYLVVGADDRLDPLAIANYKQAVRMSHADIIAADIYSENQRHIQPKKTPVWLSGARSLISAHAVGTLIKKTLHDTYGYYCPLYPTIADSVFLVDVFQAGVSIYHAPFIAGQHCTQGFSSRYKALSFAENFTNQKKYSIKSIQFLLLIVRLLWFYFHL
ncbi:putative glycosyl transferase [Thermostichus vulcanus NIES-2134]|nr:putative glycosyl transferase [Thermostichus vulcanus NIES-2134]